MKEDLKYIEIFNDLRNKINQGILKGGDKLPSKRDLAIDNNVSVNTVMNAYNLLLDEGYIYAVEKKGYYVEKQLMINHTPIIVEVNKTNVEKPLFDFTTQNMEEFHSTNWKTIMRSEISKESFLNKTEGFGDYGLREAIKSHLEVNRGIKASTDNILIGNGIEMIERVLKILYIDNITLENPGYHKLKDLAVNNNMIINYINIDDNGVLVPDYQTVLYSTPFNQFPTGIRMSITRKKDLALFLNKTNSYIIEDDFDAEFRINSTKTQSLFSLNPNRVIFFSTFTETIYPGLRLAYCILPNDICEKYKKVYKQYSVTVPTLEQCVLREFIKEGFYESHINKAKKKYLDKRKLILEAFKDDDRFICDPNKNYLSMLVKLNIDKTDNEIKEILTKNKIKIQLVSDFDINNKNSKTLILGYTAMNSEKLIEGIKALKKILN